MIKPNGAEEEKTDGTESELESGDKGKSKDSEASSPKTYSQEEVDQLLKDKENALKGAEGWEVKKLQKEVDALTKAKAESDKKANDLELARIAKEYSVDLAKAKEEGFNDPVLLEKALKLAGKTPDANVRLDSGRNVGGFEISGLTSTKKIEKGLKDKEENK